MPTYTNWRRPIGNSEVRYASPTRPTGDAIERISPEAFASPHTSATQHNWASHQTNQHSTRGLGLFIDNSDPAEHVLSSGRQLWVDQNGEARVGSFEPSSRGVYQNGLSGLSSHDSYRLQSRKEGERKRDRSKAHARSGSNIDTLATIALATSPTFTNGSPSTIQSTWPAFPLSRYDHERSPEERPAKRARSEKLPSPQWARKESRPATSHIPSYESIQAAELLLNFAQPHNFPRLQTSPPSYHIFHRSPSYKRLSESSTSSEEPPATQPSTSAHKPSNLDRRDPAKASEDLLVEGECITSPAILEGQLWTGAEIEDLKPVTQNEENTPPTSHQPGGVVTDVQQEPAAAGDAIPGSQKGDQQGPFQVGPDSVLEEKRPRRIKPTMQTTSCAGCKQLQTRDLADEDSPTFWISCNGCKRWFHSACAGFKDRREAQTVDRFICTDCGPTQGSTTFVRKSSRARTAIDYAGLNQGIVKSSAETPEHHYLQPIKEGKITFQPDEFARIKPELVTFEYFEKTDGMKRPIVIPACWNPRYGRLEVQVKEQEAESSCLASHTDNREQDPSIDDFLVREETIDCDQDLLDMVMPEDLTVRKVSELYGPEERVEVIDVKSQSQGDKKWNMRKWADYYESTEEKVVRNVISLEVSQSKLGRLIRRPKIVRDLDLQDSVWPAELQAVGDYPKVQFYCLMSVADCYTDFHIDFGGSSVYYHILKGKKTFFFIPPEDRNLKKYEDWCNSATQDTTFLGDVTGDCSRVDLSEGDTMLIPAGWIHAVWTPENSLVIGGNFLTRQNYEMQIRVANIERDTKVARKFRYPFFQKIMWYTAIQYLEDDPIPQEVLDDFDYDHEFVFRRANPVWHEFGHLANENEPGDIYFNARFYSKKEVEGLPALRDYLYRTALIAGGFHVPGVTAEAARNVKRSIPKGAGEALEFVKNFGRWCAWKTGSVVAPEWTRTDVRSTTKLVEKQEKLKQPEVVRTPPERVSSRVASQIEIARASQEAANALALQQGASSVGYESDDGKKPRSTPKTSGLGPKRVACDPCRKRRIRCRHKEDGDVSSPLTSDAPRPRAYSNISADAAQPNLVDGTPNLDGPSYTENGYPELNMNVFTTPTVALETPTSADLQNMEMSQDTSTPTLVSSSKKGRSKACDECRKSKVSYDGLFVISSSRSNLISVVVSMMNSAGLILRRRPNLRSPAVPAMQRDLREQAMSIVRQRLRK